MITCQHARHLFDRYLDGELSPSLQTELHAHQLSCGDCQSELALLESCGDVIAYDKCEPTLSASFTDRVLLARRAQIKVAPRRNWGRLFISIASPVAAAACIAMAVGLIAPTGSEPRLSLIAGRTDLPSDQNLAVLGADKPRMDPGAKVHQMPAGVVDVVFNPYVKQTRNALDSAKRTLEQLESLVGLGFAGANDTLAAGRRNMESDRSKAGAIATPEVSGPDLFAPSLPSESPTGTDSSIHSDIDYSIEAL
jgi:hypothetical protein